MVAPEALDETDAPEHDTALIGEVATEGAVVTVTGIDAVPGQPLEGVPVTT